MRKTLTITPNKKELLWGIVYLVLDITVLPILLSLAIEALDLRLSAAQLNVIYFIISFGITTLLFRNFIKRTILDSVKRFPQILFGSLRGFLLYWGGNILVTMLIFKVKPDFINVNDANINIMMESDFLPLAICSTLFVPITEELLFRGVLFAGFHRRSPALAFLVSAAVFCAIHVVGYIPDYPWDTLLLCFIQYIPASIALGWAYAKSGSILSPMLMHIAINAIGTLAMR